MGRGGECGGESVEEEDGGYGEVVMFIRVERGREVGGEGAIVTRVAAGMGLAGQRSPEREGVTGLMEEKKKKEREKERGKRKRKKERKR